MDEDYTNQINGLKYEMKKREDETDDVTPEVDIVTPNVSAR